MAVTTIPWGDGSGDNIYLTRNASEGDQTVAVTSDANTGAARSKTVIFSASGVSPIVLTVNQNAGYVTNGLVLWMDGIDKGPDNTHWVDKVSGHSFVNSGNATFNDDHVAFNGSSNYLSNATFNVPLATAGTIEIVFESDDFTKAGILFMPKSTSSSLAFGYTSSGNYIWAIKNNRKQYVGGSSGSVSISNARAYRNGTALTQNGNNNWSGAHATYSYIGRRNGSPQNYFKGKIYSIRIYDRQLTEAEVLANLAVDNIRFNLGLTL